MSYKRRGRANPVRVARASVIGAAWRTAYEPYEKALAELRECAAMTGDQAAQVCADAADYYIQGHPVTEDPDRARIIRQRLTALAEQIAGHPVTPSPLTPPLEGHTVPATPSWADDPTED